MSDHPYFWIVAWSLMGAAFLGAWIAIVVSSKMLDREVSDLTDGNDSESV